MTLFLKIPRAFFGIPLTGLRRRMSGGQKAGGARSEKASDRPLGHLGERK